MTNYDISTNFNMENTTCLYEQLKALSMEYNIQQPPQVESVIAIHVVFIRSKFPT